jgi:hypothetical protein
LEFYSPALLKNETYPDLVPPGKPVTTVAGSLLLVIYSWPQGSKPYKRVSRFVNMFFNKINEFQRTGHHPKWKEINLAYKVPGWTRFKPAQDWLDAHKSLEKTKVSSDDLGGSDGSDMRKAFEKFMRQNVPANAGELTPKQRNEMFRTFLKWWKTRKASK